MNHGVYGGLYSQMIFGESFQEPAPSEPLAGFTEDGGTWLVTNSDLLSVNGSGPKLIDNNVNQSSGDIKVQVQFSANEGGDAGIIFQVSQPGVGADVFTGYEVSLAPAGYVVKQGTRFACKLEPEFKLYLMASHRVFGSRVTTSGL